ncbi:hypothetical protein B0T14DRAFT_213644 [Immersiella caudata]|uniref:Uncharacterized protein n=1 Tax=Immersiella caudata TaxID=314043 RepID=A0AA40BZQ0_9PEZI|nr:hypothetical protein B0T14DRAFT_213644 [Immersiella caudata]
MGVCSSCNYAPAQDWGSAIRGSPLIYIIHPPRLPTPPITALSFLRTKIPPNRCTSPNPPYKRHTPAADSTTYYLALWCCARSPSLHLSLLFHFGALPRQPHEIPPVDLLRPATTPSAKLLTRPAVSQATVALLLTGKGETRVRPLQPRTHCHMDITTLRLPRTKRTSTPSCDPPTQWRRPLRTPLSRLPI